MTIKKVGEQSVIFRNPPIIEATGSIVGPKEGEGPLKNYFDLILEDDLYNEKSWEKCESKIQEEASRIAMDKIKISKSDIDYLFAGDLLNQIISSGFAARKIGTPFFGLYGACSTMAESLTLGSMAIDGEFANRVLCMTSSHFSTAERQFRFPLEFGNQRPPTAQWTVTGAGAVILKSEGSGPYITHATTGKVIDFGIKDVNNMGAAMAPAAADTIAKHFSDTGFSVDDYDLIATGDLGIFGKEITQEMLVEQGYDISSNYIDCGVKIFDNKKQDTHAGASGCGCSAVVFSGYIYKKIIKGEFKRVLLVSTGALHSPTSLQQGESVPGIAHAITICTSKS